MIEKFKNILLLKSHSAGIGDILRSSAAWKAIKNKSPDANLHLLFITNHPGYPSEELIKNIIYCQAFTLQTKSTLTVLKISKRQ